MKKFLLLVFFNIPLFAEVDWTDSNQCVLPDYSNFVNEIINGMTLEQKIGQIIMPEINSVNLDQIKQYHFGTILNGGGGFPNKNKNSNVKDWKNLSKNFYNASTKVNGIKVMTNDYPILIKYAQLEGKKATDSYTLSIQANLSINDKIGV